MGRKESNQTNKITYLEECGLDLPSGLDLPILTGYMFCIKYEKKMLQYK